MAQPVSPDAACQRLGQAVVQPVRRTDLVVQQRIDQANRVARHDLVQRFVRQQILGVRVPELGMNLAETNAKLIRPHHLRKGFPAARQTASINARSTSDVPKCARSGGSFSPRPHSSCPW